MDSTAWKQKLQNHLKRMNRSSLLTTSWNDKLSFNILLICKVWCPGLSQLLSCVQLFVTPWTVAHKAPLSKVFSRQEYWSELSFPSSGYRPHSRIEPVSLGFPALAGWFFITASPEKPSYRAGSCDRVSFLNILKKLCIYLLYHFT